MKIKYNGEIVEAEVVEMNHVRITGTDTFLSPDQFTTLMCCEACEFCTDDVTEAEKHQSANYGHYVG